MDPSPLSHQIKGYMLITGGLLLAVLVGFVVGTEDYGSLLVGTGVLVVGCVWIFSGRLFWVLTIASSFLTGTFPILRGQFTPFHILMTMGLAKFLIENVILQRARLKMPGRFDLLMIVGFMGVILFHGIHDRFGMRFLGSAIWGGRLYVSVFVGLAAFFVLQTIPIRRDVWAKFPYVVLAFSGFDLLVAIVTTLVPSSIYVIFPFYSAVSTTGMQEVVGGTADVTGRIGSFGNFGGVLAILLLANMSVRRLFHPDNFFRWMGLGVASICVLFSGFRSSVINAGLAVVLACIRDLRLAAIAVIPVLAAGLFALSVVNSEVVTLPKQIQRGLSFMPGDWDFEMARDARASNDFRLTIWKLWWKQYFPEHPLLGRGFGFKSDWGKKSVRYGEGVDYQQMVETGNIHNGLLATLDAIGILGTLFFLAWNLTVLWRALRVRHDARAGEYLTLRFVALYIATSTLFYWGGATTIGNFLPTQFAMVSLFLRLRKELKPDVPQARRSAAPQLRGPQRQLARVGR